MKIVEVDALNDDAFSSWFNTYTRSVRERFPNEPGWQPAEIRAQALQRSGPHRMELLAALGSAGAVVGSASVERSLADNQHLAMGELEIHPQWRRQGVGTALLSAIEEHARAHGANVVTVNQEDREPVDGESPGRTFARARGYEEVLTFARRDLDLPLDPAVVRQLRTASRPYAVGYSIETFADRWPEADLEDRAHMGRRMSTDAPAGDWAVDEEVWDTARVRHHETLIEGMDRALLVAVARHVDSGAVVAFSELTIPLAKAEKAWQWDTLVLDEHRGHRLGTLIKLANLDALAEAFPQTSRVATMNAVQNTPMIAVNDALGSRITATKRFWQKRLADA